MAGNPGHFLFAREACGLRRFRLGQAEDGSNIQSNPSGLPTGRPFFKMRRRQGKQLDVVAAKIGLMRASADVNEHDAVPRLAIFFGSWPFGQRLWLPSSPRSLVISSSSEGLAAGLAGVVSSSSEASSSCINVSSMDSLAGGGV